jgi:hypothetical protein
MGHTIKRLGLAAACLLGLAMVEGISAGGKLVKERTPFAGVVYDLDFIQGLNWCQVLIKKDFIGIVREPCLQRALEAALALGSEVTVYHDADQPKRITRVVLKRKAPGMPGQGLYYVTTLDFDEADGKCKATFVNELGKEVNGFTRDIRMESILTTALREELPIRFLTFDPHTNEITRGKLNK